MWWWFMLNTSIYVIDSLMLKSVVLYRYTNAYELA